MYVRDFILKEKNEHSLELFILGDINKFMEIDERPDPEYDGKKWPKWLDLNNLPDNLYPKPLSKKLLDDYKSGFPKEGEYIWQKKYSPQNDAKYFSDMHDFIMVYAKHKNTNGDSSGWARNLLPRTKEKFEELLKDNRIWFGKNGSNVPSIKSNSYSLYLL